MKKYKKVYADFFGIGQEDRPPCERCIMRYHMDLQSEVAEAVDIHHCDEKGMGGSKELDYIENLGGVCRECHDVCGSDPEENELFSQWCCELEARTLVMRAFLFKEL